MEENYSALVEQNGEGGFKSYRVPGLVTVSNGEVLIYYEGRGEEGDCRTLLGRRSLDGGRSFLQRQILVQRQGAELIHNPLMIAGPEGRVWLFWCQDYHRLFVRESWDNGEHFGPTKELTQVIEGFRSIWPVTLWAISPGHGLFLREGRLVIPLWLSRGKNAHLPACFACLFSDDLGQNWKCGSIVQAGEGIGDPTEASVAQREDGMLLATLRHEIPGVRLRAFCQGRPEKWSRPWLDQNLPDPVCSGALLALKDGRLAFANSSWGDEAALERQRRGESVRWSLDARQNLTLRLSADGGSTWSRGICLEREGGGCDLGQTKDGSHILCFYEQGWSDGNCIYNKTLTVAGIPLSSFGSD